MNKLILIKIMKDSINLYLENKLTTESFNSLLEKYKDISPSEDTISYEETLFIAFLFEKIPYYQIMFKLIDFLSMLNIISEGNPKQTCIKELLEAYLSDLLSNINARLLTETQTHVLELLMTFYQRDELPYETTIKKLKRNLINPNLLASIDTAEQINYRQERIAQIKIEEEAIREKISRTNYNKKSSVERSTIKTATKYYNEELYQKLLSEFKKVLEKYASEDYEDAGVLKDEIFPQLKAIHQKAKKKWEEPKEHDEYQLTFKI